MSRCLSPRKSAWNPLIPLDVYTAYLLSYGSCAWCVMRLPTMDWGKTMTFARIFMYVYTRCSRQNGPCCLSPCNTPPATRTERHLFDLINVHVWSDSNRDYEYDFRSLFLYIFVSSPPKRNNPFDCAHAIISYPGAPTRSVCVLPASWHVKINKRTNRSFDLSDHCFCRLCKKKKTIIEP